MTTQLDLARKVYEHHTDEVNEAIYTLAMDFAKSIRALKTPLRPEVYKERVRLFAGDDDLFVPFSGLNNPESEAYAEGIGTNGNEDDETCFLADVWAYVLLTRRVDAGPSIAMIFVDIVEAMMDINVNGL